MFSSEATLIEFHNAYVVDSDNQCVLENVNLQLGEAEIIALTSEYSPACAALMELIAGARTARSGRVSRKRRLTTSTVFDRECQVPHLTVKQNATIGFGQMTKGDQRESLIDGLGLRDVIDEPLQTLDAPRRSAVSVLRCLSRKADCYQMKDSLDFLTPAVFAFVVEVLAQFRKDNRLIVFSTESAHLAMTLATRVVAIRDGQITLDEPTAEVDADQITNQIIDSQPRLLKSVRAAIARIANTSINPTDLANFAISAFDRYGDARVKCLFLDGPQFPDRLVLRGKDNLGDFEKYLRQVSANQPPSKGAMIRQIDLGGYCFHFLLQFDSKGYLSSEALLHEFEGAAKVQYDSREMKMLIEHSSRLDSLGRIAGGVAHDVNNSIAAVSISTDLLEQQQLPRDTQQHLDTIRAAIDRMSSLSRRLVEFSRKGNLRKCNIDFILVVEEVAELLRQILGENIAVSTRCECDRVYIDADKQQIENALINIGINARDAMPSGGQLEFYLTACDRQAILTVTDSGSGMPPEIQRRAFEPFFTTKGDSGTGLGLSSVQGIVREHAGEVRFLRSDEFGTAIQISLPAIPIQQKPIELPTQNTISNRRLVLVVDDEHLVRQSLALLLNALGYESVQAATGKEGVEIFAKRHQEIGLVLQDLSLPDISGVQCFQMMRTSDPNASVVIVSGHLPDTIDLEDLEKQGLKGVMTKPFNISDLSNVLNSAIAQE